MELPVARKRNRYPRHCLDGNRHFPAKANRRKDAVVGVQLPVSLTPLACSSSLFSAAIATAANAHRSRCKNIPRRHSQGLLAPPGQEVRRVARNRQQQRRAASA